MDKGLQSLDILRKIILRIFIIVSIVYCLFVICIYQHYNNKVTEEKHELLQIYYSMILDATLNKINNLALKNSIDLQTSKVAVDVDTGHIRLCQATNCSSYDLFKIGTLMNKLIPKFINYKIELNKKLIYVNTKTQNYEIEKIYYINGDLQLNINLAVDDIEWAKTAFNFKKPFYLLSTVILSSFILLYILAQLILKYSNNLYKCYYQSKSEALLNQLQTEHQQQLRNSETLWMKKIWNINFNKQRDLELNYLFSQEANQIAYSSEEEKNDLLKSDQLRNFANQIPCSIILYQPDKKEQIDVTKLITIFTNRFSEEDENISVNISSTLKIVYFASQAALYQIIYSIINYLFFLLKKHSPTTHSQISLSIKTIDKRLKLYFVYDNMPISKKEELSIISGDFFRSHANPFLLNIHQIFNILKTNGFDCKVKEGKLNIIEIIERDSGDDKLSNIKNNVISISCLKKKKK